MGKVINIFSLALVICACEVDAIVDTKHASVLQINATIFSGERLPDILIKQTVNAPGTKSLVVDSTELFARGAEVELYVNGEAIEVDEIRSGIYSPLSDHIIEMNDVINISVEHEGRTASATATVPYYDAANFEVQIQSTPVEMTVAYPYERNYNEETYETEITIQDTLWIGAGVFDFSFSEYADFMAGRLLSNDTSLFDISYNSYDYRYDSAYKLSSFYGFSYQEFRKDEFLDVSSIDLKKNSILIVDQADFDSFENELFEVSMDYEFLVPESIYVDYVDVQNNYWAPITITNVTGGVGLFIGCAKVRGTSRAAVSVVKSPYQIAIEDVGQDRFYHDYY